MKEIINKGIKEEKSIWSRNLDYLIQVTRVYFRICNYDCGNIANSKTVNIKAQWEEKKYDNCFGLGKLLSVLLIKTFHALPSN